jgi:glycosyltransferase involved in cell wall biosynthesis
MSVTAAIPVFNGVEYLKRTVPRLLDQQFDHIYICDDASTDGV